MFIQTESTPNPATLKFLPGKTVLSQGTYEFKSHEEAEASPLAMQLFAIKEVRGVFYGQDFITVTKEAGEWAHLKPAILGAIMDFYLSGAPLFLEAHAPQDVREDEFFDPKDAETVETIKQLLEERVRPSVAADGGDITFKGFKDGIIYLAMKGACAGCPSSTATLKHGIQNLMKHFLPSVKEVQAV